MSSSMDVECAGMLSNRLATCIAFGALIIRSDTSGRPVRAWGDLGDGQNCAKLIQDLSLTFHVKEFDEWLYDRYLSEQVLDTCVLHENQLQKKTRKLSSMTDRGPTDRVDVDSGLDLQSKESYEYDSWDCELWSVTMTFEIFINAVSAWTSVANNSVKVIYFKTVTVRTHRHTWW